MTDTTDPATEISTLTLVSYVSAAVVFGVLAWVVIALCVEMVRDRRAYGPTPLSRLDIAAIAVVIAIPLGVIATMALGTKP